MTKQPNQPALQLHSCTSAGASDSDGTGERQQAVEHPGNGEEGVAGGEGGVAASVPAGAAALEQAADAALDRSSDDSGLELPLPPSHVAAGGLSSASRGAASRPSWRP